MTLNEAKEIVATSYQHPNWAAMETDVIKWGHTNHLISRLMEAAELYARSLQAEVWDMGFDTAANVNVFDFGKPRKPVNPYKP